MYIPKRNKQIKKWHSINLYHFILIHSINYAVGISFASLDLLMKYIIKSKDTKMKLMT